MWGNEGLLFLVLLGAAFAILLAAMAFNLWRGRAEELALQKARRLAQAGNHEGALHFFLKAESLWRFQTHGQSFAGKAQDLDRLASILRAALASAQALNRSVNLEVLEGSIARMRAFYSDRERFGWDGKTDTPERSLQLHELEKDLEASRQEWRKQTQRN